LKYLPWLVYSVGLNIEKVEATPIGVNCRLCERQLRTARGATGHTHVGS
jgi:predicted transcriptional regulator